MKLTIILSTAAVLVSAHWQYVQKSAVVCAGCIRGQGVTGALEDEGQSFCQHIVDTCGKGIKESEQANAHDPNVIVTWGNVDGHAFENCPTDVQNCKEVLNSIMAGCDGTVLSRQAEIRNTNGDIGGNMAITGQCLCTGTICA